VICLLPSLLKNRFLSHLPAPPDRNLLRSTACRCLSVRPIRVGPLPGPGKILRTSVAPYHETRLHFHFRRSPHPAAAPRPGEAKQLPESHKPFAIKANGPITLGCYGGFYLGRPKPPFRSAAGDLPGSHPDSMLRLRYFRKGPSGRPARRLAAYIAFT
jgi:hypothetical protein